MEPVTGPPASYLHANTVMGPLGTTPTPTPECRESRPNIPQGCDDGVGVGVTEGVTDGVTLGVGEKDGVAVYDGVTDGVTLGLNVGEYVDEVDGVSVALGDNDTDSVAEYDGVTLGVVDPEVDAVRVRVTVDDVVAEYVEDGVGENVGLDVGVSEGVAETVGVADGEALGLATAYNMEFAPINTALSAVITGEFPKSVPKWTDHDTTPNGALTVTNVPLDRPTYSRPALSKAAAVFISACKLMDHATPPVRACSAYTYPSPEPTITYPNVGEIHGVARTLYPVG